jgi:hypothetical protein
MAMSTGRTSTKGRTRTRAAALALLAVLFLLARPICAAQELGADLTRAPAVTLAQDAPQESNHSVPCCDALEESAIPVSSALAAPAAAVLSVPVFAHVRPRIARAHPILGVPAPPPLSYYARSARILR